MKTLFKIPEFECVNCGNVIPWSRPKKLFCSDRCRQEAKYVRYHRRCIAEDRLKDPEVVDAVEIKRVAAISGGYDSRSRHIPSDVRAQVFERASGLCEECGKPGIDIDHISGASGNLDNLQLLCKRCHHKKTIRNFRRMDASDQRLGLVLMKEQELAWRVKLKKPQRLCDNYKVWERKQREMQAKRKKEYSNLVYAFAKEHCSFEVANYRLAECLNGLNVPTFSAIARWDRKLVGLMLASVPK